MAAVPRTPGPVVCLVDDDPSVRRALTVLLRGHGFSVEAYAGAEHVQRRLQAGLFDCAVLIVDVHLGRVSGFDVYERLTALGLAIPAIFMTGRDDPTTRQRAARAGAKAYLVKPFDDTALVGAIRLVLNEAARHRS